MLNIYSQAQSIEKQSMMIDMTKVAVYSKDAAKWILNATFKEKCTNMFLYI